MGCAGPLGKFAQVNAQVQPLFRAVRPATRRPPCGVVSSRRCHAGDRKGGTLRCHAMEWWDGRAPRGYWPTTPMIS